MDQLVLSVFPGADLFGQSFEDLGFCVVRGPERLLGQDVRTWSSLPNRFDGLIGGPPCQQWSTAIGIKGSRKPDLIPEFVRVFEETKPRWVVMENVRGAEKSGAIPSDWSPIRLRDWDCGGLTSRKRTFFCWPLSLAMMIQPPPKRSGKPDYTVTCSAFDHGNYSNTWFAGYKFLSLPDGGRLQGFPELGEEFERRRREKHDPMTKLFGGTLLGNGVPRHMGRWVAEGVKRWTEREGGDNE